MIILRFLVIFHVFSSPLNSIHKPSPTFVLTTNTKDVETVLFSGALYTWEFCYKFLDLSKPLVRTGITCITPAPV